MKLGRYLGAQFGVVVSLIFISACGGGGGSSTPPPSTNSSPTAISDTAQVSFNQSVDIDVLANDSDADSDTLSLVSITAPSIGSASISGGQVVFEAGGVAGSTSFSYVVSDGTAQSTGTVNVTINPLSLMLNGRVVPAEKDIQVVANVYSAESGDNYTALTDESGVYSLTIEIDDLSKFVTLTGTKDGEIHYYKSHVGTAELLNSQRQSQNTIEIGTNRNLELSGLSTAISAYIDFRNENNVIASMAEMERLLEEVYSYNVLKVAALLANVIQGEWPLPDGVTSLASLLEDESELNNAVSNVSSADFAQLLPMMTYLNAENKVSNGDLLMFARGNYQGSVVDNVSPAYMRKNENNTLDVIQYFILQTDIVGDPYAFPISINHALSWQYDENGLLVATTNNPNDISFTFANQYIPYCGRSYNYYLTFDKVEVYPVYLGENLDQFIVKYSGDSTAGESIDTPCASFGDRSKWQIVSFVNLKKNQDNFSDVISSSRVALSLGEVYDTFQTASEIDLNSDQSATILLDNSEGSWRFSTEGNLEITLQNGAVITYANVGTVLSGNNFVAKKSNPDGSVETFGGYLVQPDLNLSPVDLVGRFELVTQHGIESSFALAFQDNGLGQEQSRDNEGNWDRRKPFGADLLYFPWSANSDGLGLKAEYYVIESEPYTFSNPGAAGCQADDTTCTNWQTRDFKVLAIDGELVYALLNSRTNLYGLLDSDSYHGNVRVYKRTDFILPPVE